MRKFILFGACVGALGIALWQIQSANASEEEPAYQVDSKDGNFEVRKYPEMIAAEVTVPSSGKGADNEAFSILAGYIFGKNETQKQMESAAQVTSERKTNEKIPMTVPVTEKFESDTMIMRFYMPSKYTFETLPKPLDERIRLVFVPAQKFAVIRFSGSPDEHSIERHTKQLNDLVQKKELSAENEVMRAFYNPPWTLPFLRRNELWIRLQ